MSGAELPGGVALPHTDSLPAAPDGVLYGTVARPPRMGWNGRRYAGSRLIDIDIERGRRLPGVVQVVRLAEFVGVVAVSEVLARQALDGLGLRWQSPSLSGSDACARPQATADAEGPSYTWHVADHREVAGQGVTAWCTASHATIWLQCPAAHLHSVRTELSVMLALPLDNITVVNTESDRSTDIHVLDAMDAAAGAALLSQGVGRPVRVAMHAMAGSGAITLRHAPSKEEALDEGAGDVSALPSHSQDARPALNARWAADRPWALRPSLARLLSQPGYADAFASPHVMGAAQIDGVSAGSVTPLSQASIAELEAAQVFAQESLLDEQALRHGSDPIAYRISHLPDGPGKRLAERMAEQSSWSALAATAARTAIADGTATDADTPPGAAGQVVAKRAPHGATPLRGRGYAAAHVREGTQDVGVTETWSAWVVEVEVDPDSGLVDVTRLVVGHDTQALQPAQQAAIHEQDPRMLEAARRLLQAPPAFDDWGATSTGSQPAGGGIGQSGVYGELSATVSDLPGAPIDHGQLALDGVMTLPAAAAIGNAIFDATGVRLREVPFDSEQLRARLASNVAEPSTTRRWLRRGGMWLAAGAGAVAGVVSMAWPMKPAIAPTPGPDVSLYSMAAIERGRLVAAAGDCVVCHTAPGGQDNAGGLGLDTPFGTVYTTNITPDNETGIGQWSFAAFDRAMRQGVHRDGRQLYPAFPYTAFAKLTEADMQALYAYLMVQPPVRSEPPKTELAFPYNMRPLLAGWNLLFHDAGVYQPDPSQSLEWNRGAYLVQGAGHCAACHSPRNALGAEKTGVGNYLAGGQAEGWDAPPLDRLASGKVPWTADALFQYLRTGYSASHGVAAGPMAPVIHGLAQLPESDVRAMTTYLLNLPGSPPSQSEPVDNPSASATAADNAPAPITAGQSPGPRLFEGRANGERIYQNACAVCHEADAGPTLFGVKPLLSANTNLHADTPDNLVQVILHGIQTPANDDLGYMPGFKDSLDDDQVQDLLSYLRARFAPQEPEWTDSRAVIGQIRNQSH